MEEHYQLSDEDFEFQFKLGHFDPTLFTHEAHLRLAWIHVHKYGLKRAIRNVRTQLKDFVRKAGAANKYHDTMTVSAVCIVHHFYQKSPKADFANFMATHQRLKTHFRELVEHHYQQNILTDSEARRNFINPVIPFE